MVSTLLHAPSSYYNEFVDPFLPSHNAFFIRAEHYMRYVFARQFIHKKQCNVIFDIACGDGYGTKMMSSVAERVYGFDVSDEFLHIARTNYSETNIDYIHINLDISFPSNLPKPNTIVSFETLEHIENPKRLLKMFYKTLPLGGYLLLSTPNAKLEPKKKGKPRNKFHKHVFEKEELVELLKEVGFAVENIYGQSFANILFHKKFIRDILNTITEHNIFLFKILSFLGYPTKLFPQRSYSMIVVARKKLGYDGKR